MPGGDTIARLRDSIPLNVFNSAQSIFRQTLYGTPRESFRFLSLYLGIRDFPLSF